MPRIEERVSALEQQADEQARESRARHERLVNIIEAHTQDEMEVQERIYVQMGGIEEHLRHNDQRFNNGIRAFQKLTVEDDRTSRHIAAMSDKVDSLASAVADNASRIQRNYTATERLSNEVHAMSDALGPLIEALQKIAAAAPFFEMVGDVAAWIWRHVVPIAGVITGAWAYITEPWREL